MKTKIVLLVLYCLLGVWSGDQYPIRDLSLDEYKGLAKSTFRGFKIASNVDPWLKCFGKFLKEANGDLKDGNRNIQSVDNEHILELFKGFTAFRNFVMVSIYDCRPCVDINTNADIKKVRQLIENINWENLFRNLSKKLDKVVHDFINVRETWNRQDLSAYGISIATLLIDCLAL